MNITKLSCWVWWILSGIVLLGMDCAAHAQSVTDAGWPSYSNDAGGGRYSTASQINRENVAQLKVAWTYRTGAMDAAGGHGKFSTKQGDYVPAFTLP